MADLTLNQLITSIELYCEVAGGTTDAYNNALFSKCGDNFVY